MPYAYDPGVVEAKWQKKWEETKLHTIDLEHAKKPYYSLVMFPYPSGDKLHVGHWYNFSPADSFARYMRMKGFDVFEPIGFDAFGLPAENYAIKTGTPPAESTEKNVHTMIQQLKRIGTMYDWEKTLNTSDPSYYQWTQWLFLQMYKNELAYKKLGNVNWCPSCQTVLANEQVQDGKCERCETDVIQKPLAQWYWKITNYAERLLDGLNSLDWPQKTKLMQRNWIGRSDGAEVVFDVADAYRGVIGPDGLKPMMRGAWPPALKGGVNHGTQQVNPVLQRGDQDVSLSSGLQPARRTVHLVIEPYQRGELFAESSMASLMLRTIEEVAQRHSIVLHEACVMPDHLHLLVSFDRYRHLERDIIQKLKGGSAHDMNESLGWKGTFWAKGSHFEDVSSVDQFQSVLQYIQENPTKENLPQHERLLSLLNNAIPVFTTRIDTLFSASFVVLAPEHHLVASVTTHEQRSVVNAYIEQTKKKTELQRTDLSKEKTGVFTGSYAINPANGEKIPVWIGDFVIGHYGKGAVFGDAHDERDFIFAKKYDIPLKTTIKPFDGSDEKIRALEECFTGDGLLYDSGDFNGLTSAEARVKIATWLEKKGKGKAVIQYRLRDWLVSRQRYWGAPIPIVYDPEGNPHPVPEGHLPWLLPTDVEFKPKGKSPLTYSKEFVERTEKIFGKGWTPEYDTMDTFVCSSFYYLRYLMQSLSTGKNQESRIKNHDSKFIIHDSQFIDPKLEKKWMPVSMYIGGPEHATMHLIYARFVMMALKDFGYVSNDEPFQRLVHQGFITNKGAKMSKSKGNVVSPDAFIERHGSDVFRMYLMFMGPFTDGGDWSDTGIKGIDRFVQRVAFMLPQKSSTKVDQEEKDMKSLLHKTIKNVSESLEKLHFNTAISALMELLNEIEQRDVISFDTATTYVKLLAPLAPHLADELWEKLGEKGFIVEQSWPAFDPVLLVSDTLTIAIQVNGKLRGDIQVASSFTKEEIFVAARAQENVAKYLVGQMIKKEVYVPGRLVSFVV